MMNHPGQTKNQRAGNKYAWVILAIIYLAGVSAAFARNKIAPVIPLLMESLEMDLGTAGQLVAVFGFMGVILALPGGFIIQKLGAKITALTATGSVVLGSIMGALSPNPGLLFVSRLFEGFGLSLIGIMAPAVIATWFPAQKQGTPMGIWATWMPMGGLITFVLAPVMGMSLGWQSVWWLGGGLALAALILFGVFYRAPSRPAGDQKTPPSIRLGEALANRDIWIMGLVFAIFNLVYASLFTFIPTFLVEVRRFTLTDASLISSLSSVAVMISCPLAGWLSDRIGSRKMFFTIPFILMMGLVVLPFNVTGTWIIVYMLAMGFVGGFIPTAIFAAVPDVMVHPGFAGLGMSVIILGQNVGTLGTGAFGDIVERIGWAPAAYWLIPLLAIGFALSMLVRSK